MAYSSGRPNSSNSNRSSRPPASGKRGPKRSASKRGGSDRDRSAGSERPSRGSSGDRIPHRPQHARGNPSAAPKRNRPGSPKRAKGSGGKIPPPPVLRDEVRFERIDDENKGGGRRRRRDSSAIDVSGVKFAGVAASTASKLSNRLEDAAIAFEKERFKEADNLLQSIRELAPNVAEVHELHGLVYYRMGRWIKAIKQFELFASLTGSVDQHPVWADCCRALKRWNEVGDLWYALGEASPSPELVEEGRIVYAGALADQSRVDDAIRVLEKAPNPKRNPQIYHLRRWYVLADLYERSGDLPRARRLFARIAEAEPEFGDVIERREALS